MGLAAAILSVGMSGAAHAAKKKRGADASASKSSGPIRPHVRVLSERAQVYSGAGFAYRVLSVVHRDDVLEMVERGKRGGWTRVRLETGTTGWILTEQVSIFSQAGDDEVGPFKRFGRKLRDKVLGPPTLMTARAGGTLSAGMLGDEGLFLIRPVVLISPNVGIEAYLGPSAGREVSRGLFGAAGNVYLSPAIPFTVFVSVGTGATFSRGKVDALRDAEWSYLLSPGGGAMLMFKQGITLRFDFRNHVLFRGSKATSLQEYTGGLAFHF